MKKILFTLFVLSASLMLSPASGHAAPVGFSDIRMVTGDNSTTTQPGSPLSTYLYPTDAPWIHFVLPAAPTATDWSTIYMDWKWFNPVTSSFESQYPVSQDRESGIVASWYSPLDWTSIQKPGEWKVDATFKWWQDDAGTIVDQTGSGSVGFLMSSQTVTPEPISAALFLIGGLALSTRKLFRKKS